MNWIHRCEKCIEWDYLILFNICHKIEYIEIKWIITYIMLFQHQSDTHRHQDTYVEKNDVIIISLFRILRKHNIVYQSTWKATKPNNNN